MNHLENKFKYLGTHICLILIFGCSERSTTPEFQNEIAHRAVKSHITQINTAIAAYAQDCGKKPLPEEGLSSLIFDPGIAGWSGPYLISIPQDPWGSNYVYQTINEKSVVSSSGPDMIFETEDDITTDEKIETQ